jgi:excisionase family DNA binding protein
MDDALQPAGGLVGDEMARKDAEAMNLKEAAVYLGMAENTLRKLVREGKVPAQVFSKRGMRFSRTALKEWLRGSGGRPAA